MPPSVNAWPRETGVEVTLIRDGDCGTARDVRPFNRSKEFTPRPLQARRLLFQASPFTFAHVALRNIFALRPGGFSTKVEA
jgi:hypothetical protein